jgi:hypothetical protein
MASKRAGQRTRASIRAGHGLVTQAAANHALNWPRNKPYPKGTDVVLASAHVQKRVGRIAVRVGATGAVVALVALVVERAL